MVTLGKLLFMWCISRGCNIGSAGCGHHYNFPQFIETLLAIGSLTPIQTFSRPDSFIILCSTAKPIWLSDGLLLFGPFYWGERSHGDWRPNVMLSGEADTGLCSWFTADLLDLHWTPSVTARQKSDLFIYWPQQLVGPESTSHFL